jgi:hypothetical protein
MEAEAGRFPEALELLHEGEAVLRAASWRLQLARVVAKRARVCGMQGRYEEGRVALAEARDLEEELGKIDGILRRRIEEARLQLEGSGS